jgi:hypothetical protein
VEVGGEGFVGGGEEEGVDGSGKWEVGRWKSEVGGGNEIAAE